jgi:hypothetical protein
LQAQAPVLRPLEKSTGECDFLINKALRFLILKEDVFETIS